ncbi:16343_t:CDS:2 [Cetraspora pellucida]|uniref:16343_t:CDS:1 n=1 Tax=Cetraspora pellucida TaxID=1433469 RepID=A0A9N9BAJ9_9GLOM|nr:16343_t:CDS:2 [Cetraspora pellucida]
MKIRLEGLHIWCQTCWASLYFITDSILRARPVFNWILIEYRNVITNAEVLILLTDEEYRIYINNNLKKIQISGFGLKNRGFREAALTATSLWQSLNHTEQETVAEVITLEEDLSNLEEVSENIENMQDSLLIDEIVNLSQYDIENEIISTGYDAGNMEYSPEQLVDEFLAKESVLVENYLNYF